MTQQDKKSEMIAQIVSAFASRADVTAADIAELTLKLTQELDAAPDPGSAVMPGAQNPATANVAPELPVNNATPAVPALAIEDAVTPSKVYCLCCGKGFKMLKRHLGAVHGLTEAAYRERFNLPKDFPLVAPEYSAMKAETAARLGLGKYERANADPVD